MFNIANGKGKTTVKKIKPMPGNCFYGKNYPAFISEKMVKIPIQPNEQQH
jgi:hypothetical protein